MPHAGELCALGAASCWTVSSYAFGWASRAAGSVAINQFRLWAAVLVLAALLAIRTGSPWPIGAPSDRILILCLSGCAGLVLGDVGYFHALALIGPRLCSLIMATWPAIATTIVAARDGVPPPGLVAGMLLSVTGVTVVLLRSRDGSAWRPGLTRRQWWIGVGGALLGAVGQAVGVVLAQQGMARTADLPEGVDPLATTLVRMATGAAGVQLLAVLQRRPLALLEVPRHRGALAATLAGMLFGPVLGVWASMAATQLAPLPVASALMATTPIFMLPVAKFAYGARIGWLGAGGTVLTVLGVAVLLLVG